MESVDAKISRAREHLNIINTEITHFLESADYKISLKTDPQKPHPWLVYYVEDPWPPMRLSAIIGDCVHNIRSALDNLVCGLVRTVNPQAQCSGTSFPVCKLSDNWEKDWRSALKAVPSEAQKIIKAFQPCYRPDGLVDKDPLRILSILSNRDKHRGINITTAYQRDTRFVIRANDGQVYFATLADPLYAGNPKIIVLPMDARVVQPSAHVEIQGHSVVCFRDLGPWGERSAYEVLVSCLDYVENRVVASLKPFFGQTLNR